MLKLSRVLASLFRRGGEGGKAEPHLLSSISGWTSPLLAAPPRSVSVHVVVGADSWRFAAWMLASWVHFSESAWPIRLHDDGTLSDEAGAELTRLFPGARLISRREADAAMKSFLLAFPFCETLRADDRSALRIFDALYFSVADHCISFAPHLLFFRYPREIVEWSENPGQACLFNEDPSAGSLVTAEEARDELDLEIRPHAGSGVWLTTRQAFDLEFMDSALAQTKILRGSLDDATRTLAMLCASRTGAFGHLPAGYDTAEDRRLTEDVVCRHYPPAVRGRFATEGARALAPLLLAPEVES